MTETTTAPVRFRAELEPTGRSTTAIEVPEAVVARLRGGPQPKVAATIDGRTFRTSIVRSGDRYLLGVNAERRRAVGLAPGDVLDVAVALDAFARFVGGEPRARRRVRSAGATARTR